MCVCGVEEEDGGEGGGGRRGKRLYTAVSGREDSPPPSAGTRAASFPQCTAAPDSAHAPRCAAPLGARICRAHAPAAKPPARRTRARAGVALAQKVQTAAPPRLRRGAGDGRERWCSAGTRRDGEQGVRVRGTWAAVT